MAWSGVARMLGLQDKPETSSSPTRNGAPSQGEDQRDSLADNSLNSGVLLPSPDNFVISPTLPFPVAVAVSEEPVTVPVVNPS